MAQPTHTKLLTAAARRILRPLGLRQRGSSRLWFADQGWWLIVVEFQPSGWSKGSYLNVGAMWLWFEKNHFSFDEGYRVESFAPFEDEAQFASLAENLAERAADEITRLRSLFPSVEVAAHYLAAKSPKELWESFHAGVACGLSGYATLAKRFFSLVADTGDTRDWAQAVASLARDYSLAVEDVSGFRCRIEQVIRRTRPLFKLAEDGDLGLY